MARFTAARAVNLTLQGAKIKGPPGTVFEIPDEYAREFGEYASRVIPGFAWVVADEMETLESRIEALEEASGGGGGGHPGLATHDALGLATDAELADHVAAVDPHPAYALDADLADHEGEGHVHEHDSAYAAVAHDHDGTYADPHAHPYASDSHDHDSDYAAASHSHADGDLPAGLARDSEVTAAIAAHVVEETHGGGAAGEAFPVGSVFIGVVSTDPATLLGYGTWSAFGAGRVLVGRDSGDTDFDTAEETGGAKTKAISAHAGTAVADHASHTHTYTQVPNHVHVQTVNSATTGGASGYAVDTSTNNGVASGYSTANPTGGVATGTTAGPSAALSHSVTQPSAHTDLNVVQPYIVVYMWKRTA